MYGISFCFVAGLLLLCMVGASQDDPVSIITVYNYRVWPSSSYPFFFNDFGSNFYYPQCPVDWRNAVRSQQPHAPNSPFNPDYIPFQDVSIRDIFYNPIFIASRSYKVPDRIDIHFAPRGFYSIFNETQFSDAKMFLVTPSQKSAVAFQARYFFNFRFFNFKINDFIVPDDFSFSDFVRVVNNIQRIPVFGIFEKDDFEGFHFDNIRESGKIGVYENYVEPIEVVVSSTKPKPNV